MDGFKRPTPRPANQLPPQLPRPFSQQQLPQEQRVLTPSQAPILRPDEPSTPTQIPLTSPVSPESVEKPLSLRSRRRWWLWLLCAVVVLAVIASAAFVWYKQALTPVSAKDGATTQQVQVVEGASFSYVSGRLQQRGLIRSSLALRIYAYIHNETGGLKKGTCNLLPSESAPEILKKLTAGCHDFKIITFYPGGTIERPEPTKENEKDFSVRGSLERAGFSDEAITKAFNRTYDGLLFTDKPVGTSLEGYVYGDTYYINADAGPEQALEYSFASMEKVVKQDDLVAKFKARGLTLYEGITLASIVQRELSCDNLKAESQAACYTNQQKAAQVFYSRLDLGMSLGSDVTFIYAAGLTGEVALPTVDSLYNTRIHTGLPPGPIASPSQYALRATANPASTDYFYFIAGDEGGGAMYFAKTQKEHEINIRDHCQLFCR